MKSNPSCPNASLRGCLNTVSRFPQNIPRVGSRKHRPLTEPAWLYLRPPFVQLLCTQVVFRVRVCLLGYRRVPAAGPDIFVRRQRATGVLIAVAYSGLTCLLRFSPELYSTGAVGTRQKKKEKKTQAASAEGNFLESWHDLKHY